MSFHTSECDRTVPDEFSSHSATSENRHSDGSASKGDQESIRSATSSSVFRLHQPAGDEDDSPLMDDLSTASGKENKRNSPRIKKTPIPPELLRTSVSPRAKQQFVRFETDLAAELQADYMKRTSPIKNRASKPRPVIDMRLKSNTIQIGGCWGSVDLSEAVDFKPRKRQDIRVINPIVAPTRNEGQRTVFRPSNAQDIEPPMPKYLV